MTELITRETMVPSGDPGIFLYVRNKRPAANCPRQKNQKAASTSRKPAKVTWLGVIFARAHQRVTIRAGTGQTRLVTMSVTPL